MNFEELKSLRQEYRLKLLSDIHNRLADGPFYFETKPAFVRWLLEIISCDHIYIEKDKLFVDGYVGLGLPDPKNARNHLPVDKLQTDCLEILLARMMGKEDNPSNF